MPQSDQTTTLNRPRADIRSPTTLTLAITDDCNLSCSHCWIESGPEPQRAHLSEWSILSLIEQFASLGGMHLRLSGGEPLRHPGWLRILQFAATIGIGSTTLQTNALLFTAPLVARLRRRCLPGLAIQVSLDGGTAASHDRVRGAGSFAGVMQSLDLLAAGGLADRVTINFTEMAHNLEEYPGLLLLAEQRGLAGVVAGTLVRGGRAATSSLAPPETDQYLRLLERYDRDAAFRARHDALGSMAALTWRRGELLRSGGCTFAEHPYVTPDGRMYPCLLCHTDEFAVRGVYGKGLAAALSEGRRTWGQLLDVSRQRAALLSQCRDCPGVSVCAGGCMGRAWQSCGTPWGADDRCRQRRAIYCIYPPVPTIPLSVACSVAADQVGDISSL